MDEAWRPMSSNDLIGGRPGVVLSLLTEPSSTTLVLRALVACILLSAIALVYQYATKSTSEYGYHGAPAGNVRKVPSVPSWIPLLGHTFKMTMDGDRFLKSLRKKHDEGIFSLNICGTRHHVLFAPGLTQALLAQDTKADTNDVANYIAVEVFGLPKAEVIKYDQAKVELNNVYHHLHAEDSIAEMMRTTVHNLGKNIRCMATGEKDQRAWERPALVQKTTDLRGHAIVEADLYPLVKNFIAHMSSSAIMGPDFIENFPDFFMDIWQVDKGFFTMLAAPILHWLPIPAFSNPRTARERIIKRLEQFHTAMEQQAQGKDPGPEWSRLDEANPLLKDRMKIYHKYGWSIRARSANEHALNWAANGNSNALTFWMLVRIYMDKELLQSLRSEIAPYVRLAGSDSQALLNSNAQCFDVFDMDGLLKHCALLKSCYVECLRLHTASWSFKKVKEDFILQARGEDHGWLLRQGDYCHAAHELHSTDPDYFRDPMVFRADRHIKLDPDSGNYVADLGTIRPYGGGTSMCKGRHFAVQEIIAMTAGIVSVWDVEPAGGGEWKLPAQTKGISTYGTDDTCRVWLSPRLSSPQ